MSNGELVVFHGVTDGSSATGTFSLYSEFLTAAVDHIKLDNGMTAKIWGIEISGKPVTVTLEVSLDGGSTYSPLGSWDLASEGVFVEDLRRPIRIDGITEDTNALTYFRFTWSQAAADVSHVKVNIEFIETRDSE